MSNSGGIQSVKDVVASIRRVILSDAEQDDVMCLENPENLDAASSARESPSVSGSLDITQSIGRVRHSKNFCGSVEREIQQRQISCSMELTKSSSTASFSEGDPTQDESALLSRENIAAATQEIKKLVDAAMSVESTVTGPLAEDSSRGQTVEELALSVLRPQLSEWLNQNLQRLVREVVEREISKLVERLDTGIPAKSNK
ncbi:DUF2497 domain-containing protein [Anaplasma capra]|uniref:DUF2497 domain-containing protein n=1 Tax=Anaplasma capra TaxID=1562740 RepID=UPI0021D5D81F|nr:DUF2497 domain-containing protein [Anaplasma capra]MCU7611790.1 DUF2497 domain-containing protein [Anaplasma capra]MCU7612633.1 DUF2497 domain-containing protein [Anaplasma capra]